jgi:uncharacterized iron-regulated membrane protein
VHLACGLSAGVVILIMSVTGVLLTYQKQMTEWADRQYWVAPRVEGRRAAFSDLVGVAQAHDPDAAVSSITFYADQDAPAAASLGRGRILYLDPSTAEVRGENTQGMRDFFSAVVGWHRWFNVTGDGRASARAITGWSNLVFLFLVVSGLYLWFPRRWTRPHLRPILLFNARARGKARDFNWHHVFGFWMGVPLALVVASATVISFPWASDLAYRVAGDTPPVRRSAPNPPPQPVPAPGVPGVPATAVADVAVARGVPATEVADVSVPADESETTTDGLVDMTRVDSVVESALTAVDEWRTMTVSVPRETGAPISVRIDEGWGGEPQGRHTLTYDAGTGSQTSHVTYADGSAGQRFRTFLRFTHTGEYFGIWGQTLAGLASLAGVLLVWSGFALAWRRLVQPLFSRGAA